MPLAYSPPQKGENANRYEMPILYADDYVMELCPRYWSCGWLEGCERLPTWTVPPEVGMIEASFLLMSSCISLSLPPTLSCLWESSLGWQSSAIVGFLLAYDNMDSNPSPHPPKVVYHFKKSFQIYLVLYCSSTTVSRAFYKWNEWKKNHCHTELLFFVKMTK